VRADDHGEAKGIEGPGRTGLGGKWGKKKEFTLGEAPRVKSAGRSPTLRLRNWFEGFSFNEVTWRGETWTASTWPPTP